MKRIVSNDQVIPFLSFPCKPDDVRRNPDILRSFLFIPLDPTLTDDGHCLVLDYDGFIEWFPEWNAMYRDENGDNLYADSEGEAYLLDHIDRTVEVIKGVTA